MKKESACECVDVPARERERERERREINKNDKRTRKMRDKNPFLPFSEKNSVLSFFCFFSKLDRIMQEVLIAPSKGVYAKKRERKRE